MDYLDFELEIGVGSGREYPVAVIRSAGGEARENMRFPFDDLALESHLKDVQIALLRSGGTRRTFLLPEERTVREFGSALFNALFTGDIRAQYAVIQDQARTKERGVRLKLRILAPELAALPWEFLYDTRLGRYLCLSSHTPIVRYPEVAQAPQVLSVTAPLSILAMTASPRGWRELDLQHERERLEKALKPLQDKGQVKLIWLEGHSWVDLQKAMRRGPWHIFHFIGHGGFSDEIQEGLIILENEEGKVYRLYATRLSQLLTDHDSLRLVVLNSCEGAKGNDLDVFSSTAATLVRNGIPAVLAMQYEITDKAAMALSRSFYDALADGLPVDTAVSEARKAINLEVENTLEWGTPVLYMRSPDGILFHLLQKSTMQQERTDQSPTEPATALSESVIPTELVTPLSQVVSLPPTELVAPASQAAAIILVGPQRRGISRRAVIFGLAGLAAVGGGVGSFIWFSRSHSNPTSGKGTSNPTPTPAPPIAQGTTLTIYRGHTAYIYSAVWSPDGKLVASGGDDRTVQVWDASTGKMHWTYGNFYGTVAGIAWSPDGKRIAAGSHDTTVHILDASTGTNLNTYRNHTDFVSSVAWSPDSTFISSTSSDYTVQVWDAESGKTLTTYRGHTSFVQTSSWSRDGNSIASAGNDATMQVWDVRTGKTNWTYHGSSAGIAAVSWSPDGNHIACTDQAVRVLDASTRNVVTSYTGHPKGANAVGWSPSSARIASGSLDKTVQLWDANSGDNVFIYRGHSDWVRAVGWSSDNKRVLSASWDDTVQIWQAV